VVGSQPVCTTDELPGPGEAIRVVVGEYEIGIFNVDGVWHAVDDYCTHERASLSDEGWADGDVVECSWHGARFSLVTGAVVGPPATEPLRTYTISIEGNDVYLTGHGLDE
jgi:3-phenylpropionate/trans-cinnamate dioxygenase ferredoxin component